MGLRQERGAQTGVGPVAVAPGVAADLGGQIDGASVGRLMSRTVCRMGVDVFGSRLALRFREGPGHNGPSESEPVEEASSREAHFQRGSSVGSRFRHKMGCGRGGTQRCIGIVHSVHEAFVFPLVK